MKKSNVSTLSAITMTLGGLSLLYSVSAASADGKTVYDTVCKICHGPGVMGAPKYADKADWAARVSKGIAVLESNAIKGFKGKKGIMPPKGGNPKLTDDEVKAAVAYMINSAK